MKSKYTKLITITALFCLASRAESKAQFINHEGIQLDSLKSKEKSGLQDASRIGRTSGSKAPEFQELYDYEVSNKNLNSVNFPYQSFLHKAYVLMLAEQQILNHEEAKTILKGLVKVDKLAEKDPSLQVYLPYEAALIKQIGSVAGKMHIGRSRNDMDNTTNRMYLRDELLAVIQSVVQLRIEINKKAQENLHTVMVVYTHRKEAQPITLAHYFMAIDESLAKSLDRFTALYSRIDQSPLGSGASGGTSWPLDRQRVANLLGFSGLVVNTIEGTAGWDHITEFASDNSIYMSGLGRLASEIQLWSTDEYNSVELDNSFAGISSMMPQKKNPDALERTRKAAALTAGQLMAIITSLNGIEYQHSGVRLMLEPKSLNAVLSATHAMTGVIRTLHVNNDIMLKFARQNFSTMTDLADLLVQQANLDFRDAHELIALVVNSALDQKKSADQITLEMIQDAAKKSLGRTLPISAKQVLAALDPIQSVERKTGEGMPASSSVSKMIAAGHADITARTEWLKEKKAHLSQTSTQLTALIEAF